MARNIYDVSPTGDDWKVQKRGDAAPLSTFANKDDAVTYGRSVAKANQPSQLVVRRADGTIETEYTYEDDPFPPPG